MDLLQIVFKIIKQEILNYLLKNGLFPKFEQNATTQGIPESIWDQIQQALNQFYELLWPFVTAMAGVGVVTMIVLEIWKTFPYTGRNREKSHERFFKDRINEWVSDQIKIGLNKDFPYPPLKNGSNESRYAFMAIHDLLRLSAGNETRAFYALSPNDLITQVKKITELLIDYNPKYPVLFLCFAALADKEDVKAISIPLPQPQHEKKRVTHFINKSLDGLQFKLERDWEYFNKQIAFFLNFSFVFFALVIHQSTTIHNTHTINLQDFLPPFPTLLVYFLIAVLGGFIAPVAKDLVSFLTQLKNRPT